MLPGGQLMVDPTVEMPPFVGNMPCVPPTTGKTFDMPIPYGLKELKADILWGYSGKARINDHGISLAADTTPEIVSIPRVCLNGAYNQAGQCVCNPGFSEYKGNCFRIQPSSTCPSNTVLHNGFCKSLYLPPIRNVVPAKEMYVAVPPLRVTLPLPEPEDPLDPTSAEEETTNEDDGENDHVTMQPIQDKYYNIGYRNIVNNHNVINNETTVIAHNVNNVIVHVTRKKADGTLRTVVIRNNETTVYEEESSTIRPNKTDDYGKENCTEESTTTQAPIQDLPCCTIVSPRVCRKQTDEWVCFHRKQYVCSKVCTAKVMYLRTKKPSYQHPWLIMPPSRNPFARLNLCQGADCPRPDCSGCLQGRSRCHPMCYTYDCMMDDSCHFIDQELLCKDLPEHICSALLPSTLPVENNITQPTP
uniref:Uncharacterized protein n=1 Tax=Anopheles minimus TaxID=112268 RepID=A0A182W0Y4_9DIPT